MQEITEAGWGSVLEDAKNKHQRVIALFTAAW